MLISDFYSEIKGHDDLIDLLKNRDNFLPAPKDWLVVVTDIVMSTKAIADGKYKEVNAINAAIISGILNLNQDNYKLIPFSFGGDGASLLIPPNLRQSAIDNLVQAKLLARSFNLEIRCSIIPVEKIYTDGKEILVGKYDVSPKYSQAVFIGGGMEHAENICKSEATYEVLTSQVMSDKRLNTSGFTCRWQPIKAKQGNSIALIVKSRTDRQEYLNILRLIDKIFGDKNKHHPLSVENMNFTLSLKNASIESKILNKNRLVRFFATLRIYLENVLGTWPFSNFLRSNVDSKKLGNFLNSDYIKFDGSLKMVLGGSFKQLQKFKKELDKLHQQGKIYYGIHVSSASLITCLVFPSKEFEVHFIDGADGGYALASVGLKQQISKDAK